MARNVVALPARSSLMIGAGSGSASLGDLGGGGAATASIPQTRHQAATGRITKVSASLPGSADIGLSRGSWLYWSHNDIESNQ
jgi:hypothetical protein